MKYEGDSGKGNRQEFNYCSCQVNGNVLSSFDGDILNRVAYCAIIEFRISTLTWAITTDITLTIQNTLQLGLCSLDDLDQRSAITEANLSTLNVDDEANLFPSFLLLPRSPYTSDKLIAWNHGAREPRLELLDVGRIAATKGLDDLVARGVPGVQSVHDGTAKAHLGTWLRRGMQRVIIAVQAIQESRLLGRLVLQHKVRLLVLGWREVHRLGALGSAPSALRDIEGAGADARVDLAIAHINQIGLGVDHTTRLALVVDTNDLCSELELLALRGCGEGLEELDFALAVDDAGWIEFGNVGDLDGFLGGVEVDYILGSTLEDFADC